MELGVSTRRRALIRPPDSQKEPQDNPVATSLIHAWTEVTCSSSRCLQNEEKDTFIRKNDHSRRLRDFHGFPTLSVKTSANSQAREQTDMPQSQEAKEEVRTDLERPLGRARSEYTQAASWRGPHGEELSTQPTAHPPTVRPNFAGLSSQRTSVCSYRRGHQQKRPRRALLKPLVHPHRER